MDLLDFGMKYVKSSSPLKRRMARIALKAVSCKANIYERYLMKKPCDLLENPLRDRQMLQRIMEQIEKNGNK